MSKVNLDTVHAQQARYHYARETWWLDAGVQSIAAIHRDIAKYWEMPCWRRVICFRRALRLGERLQLASDITIEVLAAAEVGSIRAVEDDDEG